MSGEPGSAGRQRVAPLPLGQVRIDDDFWSPRIRRLREQTLPVQYARLVETGRLDALRLTWRPGDEPVPHVFWDSDVAKWIEAASYSLATGPDPELESRVEGAIELLAGAQQPDGYLNTYFTVVQPGRRFTDLRDAHELYCAGHLIEAGVAHHEATGKRSLLDVACRYADLLDREFGRGPGQRRGYDGHEEIELALVKLYRATGADRYLQLAAYFVDERGQEPYYFDLEAEERGTPGYFGDHFADREADPRRYREYLQAHLPVREQTEVVGHAVRAMYLYSAMADLVLDNGDESLLDTCRTLWRHLTTRRMYVTGGIGSTADIEGFSTDFDLPNETAYAETCAAIGLVLWAHRMVHAERDRRYADVLERALYNAVLAGVSLEGTRFFYDNPLASAGAVQRREWFGVACCPPNLARLLGSLGRYVYSVGPGEAVVHLFVAGSARFEVGGVPVELEQQTRYPWDGRVRLSVRAERPVPLTLSVRVPGWSRRTRLTVAGEEHDPLGEGGYVSVRRTWRDRDELVLDLDLSPRRTYAHPAVAADAGRVALERGPLVHCLEQVDNGDRLSALALPPGAPLHTAPTGLDGVLSLVADGVRDGEDDWQDVLYRDDPPSRQPARLVAVPYCAWANREPGEMLVWVRETGLPRQRRRA